MEFEKHQQDLRTMRRDTRVKSATILALATCLVLSLLVNLNVVGTERIVLVPPNISKTFWVSKDKVSKDGLEEMAAFVAWLQLNVSPKTVDWKREVLLKWVAPEDYDATKNLMDREADRLKRNNADTDFELQQLSADERDQSVVITGRLRVRVNGVEAGEPSVRSYRSQFKYAGGRVHVAAFKEIKNANPGLPADSTAAAAPVAQ